MSGVLASYLRRRVGVQTLALLLALTALLQVLELLDVTTDILDRKLGFAGLVKYALLRTPSELMLALPLAALLGAMSALYAMARGQEIIAIRASGVSLKRLLLLLLPVPLLLASLQFLLSQSLVPHTETALKTWWDGSSPPDEEATTRWLQTRDGPVSFDRSSIDGLRLEGLRIYHRGADGLFSAQVSARTATWEGRAWKLDEVEELKVSDQGFTRVKSATQAWTVNLRPDDVVRLDVDQPHLSSTTLVGLIAGERAGSQPRTYYRTVLFKSFTAPLAAFIMLLLALPSAGALTRHGGGGGLLIALGLGLAYLLCDGILSALGTSGRIPAAVAAVTAPLVFTAIGFAKLHACERL